MIQFPPGRPTHCSIDHAALRWNLQQIRAKVGAQVKILAMVKANAYGHGAVAAAKTLLAAAGGDALGVATLEEGIELRQSGIGAPIIVVAGVYADQLKQFFSHSLMPVIYDLSGLTELEAAVEKRRATLNVHLKIDTGMGRLGLRAAEIENWLPRINALKALKIAGIFSHFSTAESVDGDYTKKQLEIFTSVVTRLRASGMTALFHFANSAATITQPAAYFDMVRPGIMLYGAYPSPAMAKQITLKPVLSWHTKIVQLKKVPAATSISYGQTFITKRESLIATLPVGYADGYQRALSNRGEALVRGKRAPVAGRVCMDLTMLDVTDIRNVQQGDEVVLLGRQDSAEIDADEMAVWANTISYEIFTSIGARVPRIHINML